MSADVVIYGAGGHGRVILDILRCQGTHRVVGWIDDQATGSRLGLPVLGGLTRLAEDVPRDTEIILAIGENSRRERLSVEVQSLGFRLAVAVHPSARLGESVELGPGTVVMAQAVLNPGARAGENVIVNTAATVDHDCVLDDLVHLGPGVHLAGSVQVGRSTQLGIGTSVIQNIRIGRNVVVGAGAVVLQDIPDGVTAVGVPARVLGAGRRGEHR